MSAFYPSTSAGDGQLTLPDDHLHRGRLSPSLFAAGHRGAPASSSQQTEPGVERSPGSLHGGRTHHGFSPAAANFPNYPNAAAAAATADFRNFCSPTAAATNDVPGASAGISSRRRRSDESMDELGRGLDLTGIDPPPPALGSPNSSSSSQRHPDHQSPPHLQHYRQQQQHQQLQREEELFLQQAARQWYQLNHGPATLAGPGAGDIVNGQSPSVFRHHEPTAPMLDISPGGGVAGGPQCHWPPPPPTYSGPAATLHRQNSDPTAHQNLELSPTQKTPGGINGVPFYAWMAVVGR